MARVWRRNPAYFLVPFEVYRSNLRVCGPENNPKRITYRGDRSFSRHIVQNLRVRVHPSALEIVQSTCIAARQTVERIWQTALLNYIHAFYLFLLISRAYSDLGVTEFKTERFEEEKAVL